MKNDTALEAAFATEVVNNGVLATIIAIGTVFIVCGILVEAKERKSRRRSR